MSDQIQSELRTYMSYLDTQVAPMTIEEMTEARFGTESVRLIGLEAQRSVQLLDTRIRRPTAGWVSAVAAAAVVVVFVGVASVLLGSVGTDAPAASTPPTATLNAALDNPPIYQRYEYEATAEMVYLDSYLRDLRGQTAWPKPLFSATTLGEERVLVALPTEGLADVPDTIPDHADEDGDPVIERPLLAGVQLDGTTQAAAFFVGIGFKNGNASPVWRLLFTPTYDADLFSTPLSSRQYDEVGNPPNIILMFSENTTQGSATVIGGLPPEASVVTTTLEDGTKVWQHTIAGMAIFLDPDRNCAPYTDACGGVYTVLDANGQEILRLRRTEHVPQNVFGIEVTDLRK